MGVACGAAGHLTVTDDDVIEKSNLTRQFLFRNHNVGKSKSLSAIEAARRINPALKSTPLQERVAPFVVEAALHAHERPRPARLTARSPRLLHSPAPLACSPRGPWLSCDALLSSDAI